MADGSGIAYFARLIDMGSPWKADSIGSAWMHASNVTHLDIEDLAEEFYGRYC